jgi:hypothetical protein
MKKFYLAAAVSLAASSSVPAGAITAFASFLPLSNPPNINFTSNAGGTGTVTSTPGSPVTFRFLDAAGTTSVFDVAATFNFLASTAGGLVAGGLGIVPATTGSVNFSSLGAVTYNGHTGTNLLTANFTGGVFSGLVGGSVASFVNSQPPGSVTFTSDFINFSQTTARDISIAINAINPAITTSLGGFSSFAGTASGSFGADLSSGSPSAVPEPASWAMMIAGFGLIGAMNRRRSTTRSVAA